VAAAPDLRMTRHRRCILDCLRRSEEHPTADQVHRLLRRRLPRTSLATVYRNLELLCERGLIRRMDGPDGRRHYDGDLEHHYHVVCERCGRVGDLHVEPIAVRDPRPREAEGFEITGHRLEFTGICPQCKSTQARRRSPRRHSTKEA